MQTQAQKQSSPYELAQRLAGKIMIGGNLVKAESSETFDVPNPATMEIICQAAQCGQADVDMAVKSAARAQKGWAHDYTAFERGQLLHKCADLLEKHKDELAALMALETGKALRTECQVEAGVLANTFRFYGGIAGEIKGETVPFNNTCLTLTLREPIGVVGAIIPWNVPLMLMALKIAPALAAGNGVVVKSAEEAPLAVLRVAELRNTILPPGVFNLISGDGPGTVALLVAHEGIDKLTFTGSVETGQIVYGGSAHKLVPVTLELGGKSPMIVCEDMDLDRAVTGALTSMRFTRQGQSCTAASRIFVHESMIGPFVEKMVAEVNKLKMGDPLDESTDMGTIISQSQYEKVLEYIRIGKETTGAVAHECSELPKDSAFDKGLFVRPVIFTGLANDHKLCQEEIFGPVTCVMSWSNFDDVIRMANDTEYGLAATIWTYDLPQAMQAIKQLDAGFVQVNQNLVVQPGLSYGGFKKSGIGKEASLEAMLEHFTRKKTVLINQG